MTSSVETTGIAGLKGALQYVRAYRDRTFVLKAGGTVLGDPAPLDGVAAQVGLLASLGIRVVLVHGGGPQASALAGRLGLETRLVAASGDRGALWTQVDRSPLGSRGPASLERVRVTPRAASERSGWTGSGSVSGTGRAGRPPSAGASTPPSDT